MLILIISILALVVGIVDRAIYSKNRNDLIGGSGFLIMFIGIIVIFYSSILAIDAHIDAEYKYQKDYMEYEILQEQIDSGKYNTITTASDIISYNKRVMDSKKYHNSPWIGLFYYDGCEKLPLLEVRQK